MRRRRLRKPAVTVALFPFLAVLVCTMGALIVLLVLVVQQARVYATVVTDAGDRGAAPPQVHDDRLRQREDFLWRREILEKQRRELTEKLANHRLQLGHLEDHIRRLQADWQTLQAAASELDQLRDANQQQRDARRRERDRLQAALRAARDELERARAEAASQPRSFAIIPYPGPNGTERRPIYIECTAQGIILQPERVLLRPQDFEGPLGPGNPLDAALRTTREHLAALQIAGAGAEPYPLLVVRPDGAVAYNVARMAMKAWDDEFGYELIDADMQLTFPPADPQLKQLLDATILEARQRQAALAAAMPSEFRGEFAGGFVATPQHGGFEALGGSPAGPAVPGQAAGRGRHAPSGQAADASVPPGSAASQTAAERSAGFPHSDQAGASAAQGGPQRQASSQAGGASMSLTPTRGRDWALPKSAPGATAITRPIRVNCYADRLVILPEKGVSDPPRVVFLPQGPQAAIDQFVNEVWQHTAHWGIAVAGGYWKPVLQMQVAPGGEGTLDQVRLLLLNSGIEVQKETQ